ncbi:hypothetical protein NDU88_002976 [Pleurodeles waltl]|uniref:Uncharacterized protein n=1 Tax=Pleurodeles waltl TaxID=8319 RepID=A0AAV7TM58_PLEWA|nr:hypothetical protein NDU88_002976 [Pleurodeles waltl]
MMGNPDIRVPDVIEREVGLCVGSAFTNTDAEEGDTESGRGGETSTTRKRRKNTRTPVLGIPLRDREVLRSSSAATSPEGRGSARSTWKHRQGISSRVIRNPEGEEDNGELLTNRPHNSGHFKVKPCNNKATFTQPHN